MKIAFLFQRMSGYWNICIRTLARISDADLLLSYRQSDDEAPYADEQFDWVKNTYRYAQVPDAKELLPRLRAFNPDVMLVSGWGLAAYRAACREFRDTSVRVLCADHAWRGSPKQRLGAVISPWFLQSIFDVAFVPGERQVVFASKMGFTQDRIWQGALSGDQPGFSTAYLSRVKNRAQPLNAFVYAGRLSPEKGIESLAVGYRIYRDEVSDPWSLMIIGAGPLKGALEGIPGVQFAGFVQPDRMPETLANAGCFVMPSLKEPWCVAIHEACAAGVPVICTPVCGAYVHLVVRGHNGYVVEPGDANSLAGAMVRMSTLSTARREAMSEASNSLSRQFTPEQWATCVLERGEELLRLKVKCQSGRT